MQITFYLCVLVVSYKTFMSRKVFYIVTLVLLLSSCSAYKYVPEGEYLLRKTSVKTDIPKEDLGNANLNNICARLLTPESSACSRCRCICTAFQEKIQRGG